MKKLPSVELAAQDDFVPVPFEEARDFFASLVPLTDAEFLALADEVRRRAFTVAHVSSMEMLLDIHREIERSIADGVPFGEFQGRMLDIFEEKGWTGPNAAHMETVFRTNVQTAYGVGRLEQHQNAYAVYPYGRYISVMDGRERKTHRALHGEIHHMNSRFWREHYPPWEYNCRCSCIPMSEEEVRGKQVSTLSGPAPTSDFQSPGQGFDFGDPDQAVKILMDGRPRWSKSEVMAALEDAENVLRSRGLFNLP